MNEDFKLPVSSYDEIMKVIIAYGSGKIGVSVSLDDLVKVSGMGRTVLSKNNGFLIQTNLISKGSKKAPTDLCKKLADAYSMGLSEEISKIWRGIVERDEFMSKMISVVSVRKSISRQDYVKHIVYTSGCGKSAPYKTGASALVDIFKTAGVIDEDNGNIVIGGVRLSPITDDTHSSIDINVMKETEQVLTIETEESVLNPSFYIQQYTCESGQIAKIIIPENATEDDLLGFRDMVDIAMRRKFKIKTSV